jgi:hypothetical protein
MNTLKLCSFGLPHQQLVHVSHVVGHEWASASLLFQWPLSFCACYSWDITALSIILSVSFNNYRTGKEYGEKLKSVVQKEWWDCVLNS